MFNYVVLIVAALTVIGCKADNGVSEFDLVKQAEAYEMLYFNDNDLSYNDEFDLYFVKKSDEIGGISEAYLISLNDKVVYATLSVGEPIGQQFFLMLKENPELLYSNALNGISVNQFELSEKNCPSIEELINSLEIPFEPYQKPPHKRSVEGAKYFVQQKEDKFGIVLTSINTSSESLPIIRQFLSLREKILACKPVS